jgi:alpha-glucosidase
MRYWLNRGVDGFRLDALPMLVKDEQLRDNPANPDWRTGQPEYRRFKPARSVDQPDIDQVLGFLRRIVDEYPGSVLLAELGLPPARLSRYHEHIQVPLNFGLITQPWTAQRLHRRISAYLHALPAGAWPNWVLGNHDVSRVATRLGPERARAAAVLLLTLPGTVTLYYGDELGLPDYPSDLVVPRDRLGVLHPSQSRDPQRTPMPWDGTLNAGFSRAEPWLPVHPDAARLSVAAQHNDAGSMLSLHRRLLRLRRDTPALALAPVDDLSDAGGVLSFRRGPFQVALNTNDAAAVVPLPAPGRVLLSSRRGDVPAGDADRVYLEPAEAVVVRVTGTETTPDD